MAGNAKRRQERPRALQWIFPSFHIFSLLILARHGDTQPGDAWGRRQAAGKRRGHQGRKDADWRHRREAALLQACSASRARARVWAGLGPGAAHRCCGPFMMMPVSEVWSVVTLSGSGSGSATNMILDSSFESREIRGGRVDNRGLLKPRSRPGRFNLCNFVHHSLGTVMIIPTQPIKVDEMVSDGYEFRRIIN